MNKENGLDKQMNKENTDRVWDEAIADAERIIEGYKGRIAKLRSAVRILRGLKKKSSTVDN